MINSTKKIFTVFLVLLNAFVLYKALTKPVAEFDTTRLVAGMPALASCLSGMREVCADAPYFAPLQQLPALGLHTLGVGYDQILLLLVWLNTAFVLAMQFFFWQHYSKDHISVIAFLSLVLLTGPISPYLTSSFSEAMVVGLLGFAIFAFIKVKNAVSAFFLFFLLSISKDTAPLWCFFLAVALFYGAKMLHVSTAKKKLVASLSGVFAGALFMAGFNLLRYDSFFNTFHSQKMFMSESAGQTLSQFLALIFSPNGGLLYFWPILLVLVLYPCFSLKKFEPSRNLLLFLGCNVVILGGLFFSLSLFYSPFGWVAWGSRLTLPWLFAIAISIVVVSADVGERLDSQMSAAMKWTLGIIAGLWQLPHTFVFVSPSIMMSVFKPTEACPGLVSVAADKALNTVCMNEFMWPKGLSVLLQSWSLVQMDPLELGFYAVSFGLSAFAVVLFLDDYLGHSDGI